VHWYDELIDIERLSEECAPRIGANNRTTHTKPNGTADGTAGPPWSPDI
jgi:hypothetical protein